MLREEQRRRSWEGRKGWKERTGRELWKYWERKMWRWECQTNSKSAQWKGGGTPSLQQTWRNHNLNNCFAGELGHKFFCLLNHEFSYEQVVQDSFLSRSEGEGISSSCSLHSLNSVACNIPIFNQGKSPLE